jgi:hypothetical protein
VPSSEDDADDQSDRDGGSDSDSGGGGGGGGGRRRRQQPLQRRSKVHASNALPRVASKPGGRGAGGFGGDSSDDGGFSSGASNGSECGNSSDASNGKDDEDEDEDDEDEDDRCRWPKLPREAVLTRGPRRPLDLWTASDQHEWDRERRQQQSGAAGAAAAAAGGLLPAAAPFGSGLGWSPLDADATAAAEAAAANATIVAGERLRPDGRVRARVPSNVARLLQPYQRVGVRWLYRQYRFKKGAVLGDDMGLGKTVQVIALLTALCHKSASGRKDMVRTRKLRRAGRAGGEGADTRAGAGAGAGALLSVTADPASSALSGSPAAADSTAGDFTATPAVGPPSAPLASASTAATGRGVILIVTPSTIVRQWMGEINRWGCFVLEVLLDKSCRESVFAAARSGACELVLASYEQIKMAGADAMDIHWRCIFFDEVGPAQCAPVASFSLRAPVFTAFCSPCRTSSAPARYWDCALIRMDGRVI